MIGLIKVNLHCLLQFFNGRIFKEDHRVITVIFDNGSRFYCCSCGGFPG